MSIWTKNLLCSQGLVRSVQITRVTTAVSFPKPSNTRMYATPSSKPASAQDPTLTRAQELLDLGTRALEDNDLTRAKGLYKESIDVRPTSEGWHNLANCEYHLQNKLGAIEAWEKSIAITPSADAHTNLASAYVFDKPPKPALAIKHLTAAFKIAPNDPEIAFNLAAVLESTGNLEQALQMYTKAEAGGIDRAAQNVRNVSAKILGNKAKTLEGKQ